jgi:hypothetical protein
MKDERYWNYGECDGDKRADDGDTYDAGKQPSGEDRGLPLSEPLQNESGNNQSIAGSGVEGETREGCVYFIETHDGAFVKIGYSTNLPRRLEGIGVQLPGLRLIGHMPGTFATERWLHAKFAAYRERGEWFRQDREVQGFIWNIGLIEPIRKPIARRIPALSSPPPQSAPAVVVQTPESFVPDECVAPEAPDSEDDPAVVAEESLSQIGFQCAECGMTGLSERISPKGSVSTFLTGFRWRHRKDSPTCSGFQIRIVLDESTLKTAEEVMVRYKDQKRRERESDDEGETEGSQ